MPRQPKVKQQCITPNCTRFGVCRGLCHNCRQTLLKAIQKGVLTETEAIEAGLVKPKPDLRVSKMYEAIKAWQREQEQENIKGANTTTNQH